jgi:hypothetical protein
MSPISFCLNEQQPHTCLLEQVFKLSYSLLAEWAAIANSTLFYLPTAYLPTTYLCYVEILFSDKTNLEEDCLKFKF